MSSSKWTNSSRGTVNAGAPQGSILGQFTLTIYQMECLQIANFLSIIRLFSQWLTTSNQEQLPYAVT